MIFICNQSQPQSSSYLYPHDLYLQYFEIFAIKIHFTFLLEQDMSPALPLQKEANYLVFRYIQLFIK